MKIRGYVRRTKGNKNSLRLAVIEIIEDYLVIAQGTRRADQAAALLTEVKDVRHTVVSRRRRAPVSRAAEMRRKRNSDFLEFDWH
jgi:hypothetical protein